MHDDDVKVSLHQKSAAERRVTVGAGNTLNKPLPEYVDADIALSITPRGCWTIPIKRTIQEAGANCDLK